MIEAISAGLSAYCRTATNAGGQRMAETEGFEPSVP
jgi:hypothetical protein